MATDEESRTSRCGQRRAEVEDTHDDIAGHLERMNADEGFDTMLRPDPRNGWRLLRLTTAR